MLNLCERGKIERRFAASELGAVIMFLRERDSRLLRLFRCLSLSLGRRRHKGNEGIPHGLLHGVFR